LEEEELMPAKHRVLLAVFNSSVLTLLLASALIAQEATKPRVYISDSQSWQMSGGFGGSSSGFGGISSGGARPQTAEIIKTFNEKCPNCTVTANKDKADYVVILEHEGGKDPFSRDNKFALLNRRRCHKKRFNSESGKRCEGSVSRYPQRVAGTSFEERNFGHQA